METLAPLKQQLKQLRLKAMHENLDIFINEAIRTKLSYADFLLMMSQSELDARYSKKRETALKKSNMGRLKRIEEFDFDFNPGINRQLVMKLLQCDFIRNSENILIAGPTGVGKTFLAKSLGYEAVQKGYSVVFTRTNKMLEDIFAGKADNSFNKRLSGYVKPDLLILDDWGMIEFGSQMLHILNELISERYEKGAIIITSNRPVENWAELFPEKVIGSALLDRLLHQAHPMIITGKSYRTGGKKLQKKE